MNENLLPARPYSFTLQANGIMPLQVRGNYYKITASTGAVTVSRTNGSTFKSLLAGQGERNVDFDTLIVQDASGATNVITIVVGGDTFVDERMQLASSQALETAPAITVSYVNDGTVAIPSPVNPATQIIAGSPNGMIVTSASLYTKTAAAGFLMLIGAAAAPTSISGDVICVCPIANPSFAQLPAPVRLRAGHNLYVYADSGIVAGSVGVFATATVL